MLVEKAPRKNVRKSEMNSQFISEKIVYESNFDSEHTRHLIENNKMSN